MVSTVGPLEPPAFMRLKRLPGFGVLGKEGGREGRREGRTDGRVSSSVSRREGGRARTSSQ